MKYYLDTEFLEGPQKRRFCGFSIGEIKSTIDLISIGIVAEDGREYYAISKDFNLKEAWNRYDLNYKIVDAGRDKRYVKTYWIRENVLKPIFVELRDKEKSQIGFEFTYNNFKKLIKKYGKSNKEIAEEIFQFLTKDVLTIEKAKYYNIETKDLEFYTYYGSYDWVAFCWLFGKMINLPKGFPMYSRDLKQILDERIEKLLPITCYQNNEQVLEFLKSQKNYPVQIGEHNALSDAKWNKELHEFLNKPLI